MRRRNQHAGWDERVIEGFLSLLSRIGNDPPGAVELKRKFLGYHDLLEPLKHNECPLCVIIHRSTSHYVATAFIEEVTNGQFREEMRTNLGFCGRHSKLVLNILPWKLHRMGVAIVYEDLLAQVQVNLAQETLDKVPEHNNCALCSFESELSDYALQLIADYCDDPEFQSSYSRSDGLCFPHLRALCHRLSAKSLTFFLAQASRKLSILRQHLSAFQRKNDYRFAHEEVSADEAHAGQRAVRFMTGSS